MKKNQFTEELIRIFLNIIVRASFTARLTRCTYNRGGQSGSGRNLAIERLSRLMAN